MLESQLQQLGFNQKERSVYQSLAEAGKSSASELSKTSGIARATVYSVLECLINKGVVSQEHTRGRTLFIPNDPGSFLRLIEREKEALEQKAGTANELIDLLSPYFESSRHSIPKIQLFEGKTNVENMLWNNIEIWRANAQRTSDGSMWGYQDHTVVEEYQRWHDSLWKTAPSTEECYIFTNDIDNGPQEGMSDFKRHVKILPSDVQFASTIWLTGEYIIMLMTRRKPHYALQMRDHTFSSNLRAIFKLLWRAEFN